MKRNAGDVNNDGSSAGDVNNDGSPTKTVKTVTAQQEQQEQHATAKPEVVTVDDVHTLEFRNGSYTLGKDGIISGKYRVEQSGNILIFEGASDTCFVVNGGGVSSFVNGGVSTMLVNANGTINMFVARNSTIWSDGSMTDGGMVDDDGTTTLTCLNPATCRIESVRLGGNANVTIDPAVLPDDFSLSIQGNAQIDLRPGRFNRLTIEVGGNGKVTLQNVSANSLTIEVGGNGKVSGIHVNKDGTVNSVGNGDVFLTASDPEQIRSHVNGNGDVYINKAPRPKAQPKSERVVTNRNGSVRMTIRTFSEWMRGQFKIQLPL